MTETQIIENLLFKIELTRHAQRTYFKNSNGVNLKISKGLETDLDDYTRELRRKGYEPKDANPKAEQKRMFDAS